MSWPDGIIRYKDGTTRALTRATLASDWADMPIHNIVRIEINPAFFASDPGEAVMVSGGDAYWAYAEGANSFVLGVRSYEWDETGTSWDLTKPNFHEFVFDKRTGRARVERDQTAIPAQALVRYAE